MTFVQVLHFQGICIALQLLVLLLLLPLPLLRSSPCPSTVEEIGVATTSDAKTLAEALLCDGPANFTVSWHGDVRISQTLSVSNGSTLNVTGSESTDDAGTGAVVTSDGTFLLFEVDLGSTVSLTGLTLSGGDGGLRVTGDSFVRVIDCNFTNNKRNSSDLGDLPLAPLFMRGHSLVEMTEYDDNAADIIGHRGAIFVNSNSSIVLKGQTVFVNNMAAYGGGAVYIDEGSNASFGGETAFVNNTAEYRGGAIFVNSNSSIVLKGDTVFANNTAYYGGAIFLYSYSEGNFAGNASFEDNHAIYGGGGAIFVNSNSSIVLKGETFFANNTADDGGGAIFVNSNSSIVLKGDTVFANNTADDGGAIVLYSYSEGNFAGNASFEGNRAFFGGGGAIALIYESIIHVDGRTSFVGNEATYSAGGAIFVNSNNSIVLKGETVFAYNTAYYGGGAIFVNSNSSIVLKGDTVFANNTADDGGAIALIYESIIHVDGRTSFVGNEATYDGGAIFLYSYSEGNFAGNASFEDNHAIYGGGAIALIYESIIHVDGRTSFVGNGATYLGGAVYIHDDGKASFGGETVFADNTAEYGGAIALIYESIIHVDGRTSFVGNEATYDGGVVYIVDDGKASFGGDTVFANNTAEYGGAVYIDEGSNASFGGEAVFANNTADIGGAIYSSDSALFVETGTRFVSNVASIGSGGGVYASQSVLSIHKAVFTGNLGVWGGGVAFFASGSIWDERNDDFGPSNITGCHFDGNAATEGGAIYTAAGYDMVVSSSFTRNFAAVQGGALLHSGVLVALTNCTFEDNMAGEDGLAVMSLGIAENISALSFRNNVFFCPSGEYRSTEDSDMVEDSDTCRRSVVCSLCTDPQCAAHAGIDMVDNTTIPVCELVPEGVNTTGNSGMTLETLHLMSGFFRTSNKSTEVLECYREYACTGGSIAGSYCTKGYAGPYCAACDEGYDSGFRYSCNSCQRSDKWAWIGGAVAVLVVAMIVIALGVAYLVGVVDRPISERSGIWERRVSNFRDGLARAIPLTAIKIVLVSWQIITQFSGVVNIQYPRAYEKYLAALSVVNLNLGSILSLSCVMEIDFYARLVLATIAPMAVLSVLAITYGVAMVRNGHSIHAMRFARNKHISVGLFLLFVVYSSVSCTIFQTFVCDPLDSGITYLRADYDLVCWTTTHKGFMKYAGIMVLVYPVGIPTMFAWMLFINRDGIKGVEDTTNGSQVPPESEAIKDLWAPYKPSRYYYEVIECGRRISLTGLALFLYPGSTAQVAIEALLAFVFISLSEIISPFVEPLHAWLYRSGTWVIFLNMYVTLLLKLDAVDEDSYIQSVFTWLLIAAHGGMVLVVIAKALLSALKGFREVRAIEMPVMTQNPSQRSGSTSTRVNDIGILGKDEDDVSSYHSNPRFAGRPQINIPPL